jgi:hypothetical protein
MEDTDFKRKCLKAFLRFGASVPDPRKDNRLREAPLRFHAGQELPANMPAAPGRTE